MTIATKTRAPEKAASQFSTPEDALSVIAIDLLTSAARLSEFTRSNSENSERYEAARLIAVDASPSAEESSAQYVKPPENDPQQPEYHSVLKHTGIFPLVAVHFDTSRDKYPWSRVVSEQPIQFATIRPMGQRLPIRHRSGAGDLLSALSKAQRAVRQVPGPADRARFRVLADKWVRETEGISVHSRAVMHRSYQQIIGMGPVAIPLLLEELREHPDHWMWALSVLADEDPSRGARTFSQARATWLSWGQEKDYIGG
jgi:hypothetical protein